MLINAEINDKGPNPRFVVTNINGADTERFYNKYAQQGDPENRIKELKNALRIDRTSCHCFLANQFRLFLHAAAFVLFGFLRQLLSGTQWAKAHISTLQRDLIKLGVRVKQTDRKVWLSFGKLTALSSTLRLRPEGSYAEGHFASACPVADLWPLILRRLHALA